MGLAGLIDIGVDGYLWKPEAMTLYEIAYFTRGDVLELGTFRGLSTSIIAHALHDPGSGTLITCDLDPASTAASRANIAHLPGGSSADLERGGEHRDLRRNVSNSSFDLSRNQRRYRSRRRARVGDDPTQLRDAEQILIADRAHE